MTLKEFAESRNVEYNTLMQWLYRRPDLREQMSKEGKSYILDPESEVYEILDKKYPFPRPIQIVQDEEARAELAMAQKKIQELQDRLLQVAPQLARLETMDLLLEQREQELEKAKMDAEEKRAEAAGLKEETEAQKIRAERAEAAEAEARAGAEEARTRAASLEAEAAAQRARAEAAEEESRRKEEQVEKMENAGLLARIFKSW